MGKLPYIPLYIGDWEQDTNSISLESEGALLKLIFKLWKAQPQKGVFVTTWKALSILLKKSDSETRNILAELRDNDILIFENFEESVIKIISRRMVKDSQISRVRSTARKGKGKNQINNKTKSKRPQKREYENEYGIDNGNENGFLIINETTKSIDDVKNPNPMQANVTWKSNFWQDHEWFKERDFLESWDDYCEMRREKKKPINDKIAKRVFATLLEYSSGYISMAIEILQKSYDNKWTDVYEIKKNNGAAARKQSSGKINDGYSAVEAELREKAGRM